MIIRDQPTGYFPSGTFLSLRAGREVEAVVGGGLDLVVGEGGAVEWEYWVLGERMRATMRIIQSSSKVGLFMGNSGLGVDVCLHGNSGWKCRA